MTTPILCAMAIMAFACTTTKAGNEPKTVAKVDVKQYMGLWFEIASYPQWFERGMSKVQALYTLNSKGYVDVHNSGIKNGKKKTAHGKAKVVDKESNAKLAVSFFGPFYAAYWIIDLAEDYSWAVVSDPKRKTLWILSRTPQMDEITYDQICFKLKGQGFDLSKLVRMEQ